MSLELQCVTLNEFYSMSRLVICGSGHLKPMLAYTWSKDFIAQSGTGTRTKSCRFKFQTAQRQVLCTDGFEFEDSKMIYFHYECFVAFFPNIRFLALKCIFFYHYNIISIYICL